MAQTTYYSILESPAGYRLVQQCGNSNFVNKAKAATLTIGFRKLISGHVRVNRAPRNVTGLPYLSASQFTALTTRSVLVKRTSKATTNLAFSYKLVGY